MPVSTNNYLAIRNIPFWDTTITIPLPQLRPLCVVIMYPNWQRHADRNETLGTPRCVTIFFLKARAEKCSPSEHYDSAVKSCHQTHIPITSTMNHPHHPIIPPPNVPATITCTIILPITMQPSASSLHCLHAKLNLEKRNQDGKIRADNSPGEPLRSNVFAQGGLISVAWFALVFEVERLLVLFSLKW